MESCEIIHCSSLCIGWVYTQGNTLRVQINFSLFNFGVLFLYNYVMQQQFEQICNFKEIFLQCRLRINYEYDTNL